MSGWSKDAPTKKAAPTPLTELAVKKVSADLSKPDPNAAYWSDVPAGLVKMLAQPMIAPRPETTTNVTPECQAVDVFQQPRTCKPYKNWRGIDGCCVRDEPHFAVVFAICQ